MIKNLKILWARLSVILTTAIVACNGGGGSATPSVYNISGTITYNGSDLSSTTVTVNGETATTDNNGCYIMGISMKDGNRIGPSDKPNKLYVWPVRGK